MCGIVGIISTQSVTKRILTSLKRLEYRGYDSAGISAIKNRKIERCRAAGKLSNLERALVKQPISGSIGIGHTRWATHGVPSVENAHPHVSGQVAVVHNGIIENYQQLKEELAKDGVKMRTETDTEVVAHLANAYLQAGMQPKEMMEALLSKIQGAFALLIMMAQHPDTLLAARKYSPLAIAYGDGEMFLGSDALALAHLSRKISYLEDGDWAIITKDEAKIFNLKNEIIERPSKITDASNKTPDKGKYAHYMEKEINEQPEVIGYTFASYCSPTTGKITLPKFKFCPSELPKLTIVAAGTSFYAGMVAKYWFENLARIPTEVDIASEFRYRNPVLIKNGAALFISQSGESLDTLMAQRYAKENGQNIISLVNVPESTIARESDTVLKTLAGPEISVASTKAFTTQLVTLLTMAVHWGEQRGVLSDREAKKITDNLSNLPSLLARVLSDELDWVGASSELALSRDVIYLGRGVNFPIALEGALKLKEISYIHAEGYAAGEMKHGPIALLERGVPVVMVAPHDEWFEKTSSNLKEALARGARVVLLSDDKGIEKLHEAATWIFRMPRVHPMLTPILYSLPVQLLAYHTAKEKGTEIDQPRNLAKSVTVE